MIQETQALPPPSLDAPETFCDYTGALSNGRKVTVLGVIDSIAEFVRNLFAGEKRPDAEQAWLERAAPTSSRSNDSAHEFESAHRLLRQWEKSEFTYRGLSLEQFEQFQTEPTSSYEEFLEAASPKETDMTLAQMRSLSDLVTDGENALAAKKNVFPNLPLYPSKTS